MLIKAEPVIQAVEKAIDEAACEKDGKMWKVVYMSPSEEVFDQKMAHEMSHLDILIFVCGRYE